MLPNVFRIQVLTLYEGRNVVDAWVTLVLVDSSRPVSKADDEAPFRDKYLSEQCKLSTHRIERMLESPKPDSRDELVKSCVPNWMSDRLDAILGRATWRGSGH